MAGYSGTPLPKKLGIKPGATVCTINAPKNFRAMLGKDCPVSARFIESSSAKRDLTIWFIESAAELKRGMRRAIAASGHGSIWFAWQKKSSGVATDVSGDVIRRAALAGGIVDYKVCAIDEVWSALLFARRKSAPSSS